MYTVVSFVANEDLCGQNVLQLSPFVLATAIAQNTSEKHIFLP